MGGKGSGRRRGRPLSLTKELSDEFCKYIQAGNYIETACNICGVSKSAVFDWLSKGNKELARVAKDPDATISRDMKLFVDFVEAVKGADGIAEARDIELINRAAKNQWQAAAWRLERKHYKRWGKKQNLELTGEDGGPIKTEVQTIAFGDKVIKFE